MKLDKDGLVVMEQCGAPGNVGDSCAETSRLVTLQNLLKIESKSSLQLFVTDKGILRYPTSPWPESDTSSDQVAPLIAAAPYALQDQVIGQIKAAGYRTGNGNLITLGLLANLKRAEGSRLQAFYDLALVLQALVFLLPVAFNPSATLNPLTWLVSSSTQTSGYLNFVDALAFARQRKWTISCWLACRIVHKAKVMGNITSYYSPEPNVAWLLALYTQALPQIWR